MQGQIEPFLSKADRLFLRYGTLPPDACPCMDEYVRQGGSSS